MGGGRGITGLIEAHPQYEPQNHFTVNTMRHPKEAGSDLRRLLGADWAVMGLWGFPGLEWVF